MRRVPFLPLIVLLALPVMAQPTLPMPVAGTPETRPATATAKAAASQPVLLARAGSVLIHAIASRATVPGTELGLSQEIPAVIVTRTDTFTGTMQVLSGPAPSRVPFRSVRLVADGTDVCTTLDAASDGQHLVLLQRRDHVLGITEVEPRSAPTPNPPPSYEVVVRPVVGDAGLIAARLPTAAKAPASIRVHGGEIFIDEVRRFRIDDGKPIPSAATTAPAP